MVSHPFSLAWVSAQICLATATVTRLFLLSLPSSSTRARMPASRSLGSTGEDFFAGVLAVCLDF